MGISMNVLFLCNQGENRSRTSSEMWAKMYPEHRVKYAGFYNNVDDQLLDWADKIIVFERQHEDELKSRGYSYWGKSYNISVDDLYVYNSNQLKALLREKLKMIDIAL
jgi:predicted protein tyrosine phosphatase